MMYIKKPLLERIMAMALAVLMMISLLPANVFTVSAEPDADLGVVTPLTGGTVTGNGTNLVEVVVEETTLQWVEGNDLHAEGWWVGIKVTEPAEVSADATYKRKSNPNAEYGEAIPYARDGADYMEMWFPVSAESLEKFAGENRNLIMTYAFDWDGNMEYEQTIVFSVVPSGKITLMKGAEQVYPVETGYGSVTTFTGGKVENDASETVTVTVEETALQWVEGNELRAEGWWVGIKVTEPAGTSESATYKRKTNPNAEYGDPIPYARDGADYMEMWFGVSPESLEKFAKENRNLTMTYTFDWDGNGVYDQTIIFSVVPSGKIVLMKGEEQVYPVETGFGTVTALTGGEVENDGTDTVAVTVEETTLQWVEGNELRAEGWWVGIKVTEPAGTSESATYKRKTNPNAEYGDPIPYARDGADYMEMWFPVSAASLEKFAGENRNLIMTYAFDWDGNGVYDQTIIFSVVPSGKIVLMKGEEQVYPVETGYGSVTTFTGGEVENDASETVTVTVEETVLEWVEGNELHAEGWWVGIKVTEPAGTSASATYKRKNNPADEYGEAIRYQRDGADYMEMWFPVSAESLEKFAKENRNLTMTYTFDWDGNGVYDQTIIFSVVPSEKIVLMKDGQQIYPQYVVSVSKNEGGSVTLNEEAVDSLIVNKGTTVNLSVQADEGYRISTVTVNGEEIAVNDSAYVMALENVDAHTSISVVYVKLYTVTVNYNSAYGNVSTDPENNGGSVIVEEGTEITVDAVPEVGYHVSSVKINGVDQGISAENGKGCSLKLLAQDDGINTYLIEVEFAINVYELNAAQAENGSFVITDTKVAHGGATTVTVTPAKGYTVAEFSAEGATVSDIVKDENGIHFEISDIVSDLTVVVTFKETAKAAADAVAMDTENVALRKDDGLFVVKTGTGITFQAETGMRLYDSNGVFAGDAETKTILVNGDTTIVRIELYYQDTNELYADWHIVELGEIRIVNDTKAPTPSLAPETEANQYGYYKDSVTLNASIADEGDYSGIAKVEYWITYNGVAGAVQELDGFTAGAQSWETKIAVDANIYNSDDIVITLKVTDLAGNTDTTDVAIKINATDPTIQLNMDGTQDSNALAGYYESNRNLTITIKDRAGTFDEAAVLNGLKIKKNGEEISLQEGDITWTHSDDGETHVGKYTFTEDGNYEWSLSYTNKAGRDGKLDSSLSDQDIYSFVIDRKAPVGLKISYDTEFVKVLLETVTFGFYKPSVTVTIEATDVSGIQKFVYSYTVQEGASNVNQGKKDIVITSEDFVTNANGTATASFTIPAQFRGNVSFTAMDKSGQISEMLKDGNVVVVDNVAPGVTVTYDNNNVKNGKYYDANRTATITIEEANFFGTKEWGYADLNDEYLIITVGKTLNDGTYTETKVKPEFTKNGDFYEATVLFDENADYTFDIKYTDRSGNVYDEYVMDEFTIDKIKPVISMDYDNHSANNDTYYKANRTATITVDEHNFRASDVQFTISATDVTGQKPVDLSAKGYAAYLQNQDNWTQFGDTWTAEILLDVEGNYTIGMTYGDLASNPQEQAISDAFCIDKSDPKDLKISYNTEFVKVLLETVTFGFYKPSVTVTIEATDDYAGIDYFTYSYIVEAGASSINEGKQDVKIESKDFTRNENGTATATFTIPAQFRGNVSFKAYDMAGNYAGTADENVVVVDNVAPGVTVSYDNNDVKNGKYYDADRTATIIIEEANFFGTADWGYADLNDEYLVITVGKTLNDGTYTETKVKPEFTKDGDVYEATVLFDENADYTFDIKYTDRSGNVYDEYVMDEFTIDKIKPVISIDYNNKNAKNDTYYKANRTATITVEEHNFRASDVQFTIAATDVTGEKPVDLSEKGYAAYLQNQDSWTQNGNIWTAQILLDIEGNYTIGMTYADLAENPQEKEISDAFCIDKSLPENLKISYNTEFIGVLLETITFGFYQAPVTVTIEATDDYAGIDYFTYSYIVEAGASSINEGKKDVVISRDAISYEGNHASATFTISAQFRGNVSFTATDMADNRQGTEDKNVVIVDNKPPVVMVSYDNNNAKNGKYYDADRTATIIIEEANFFGTAEWGYADLNEEYLVITVGKTLNDGTYTETKMKPEFTKNGDTYTATILFDENADYTFDIKYTDRSGNVYDDYEMDVFTIDKIDPTIQVTYNDAESTAKNGDQFKADRVATIVVTEHNFIAQDVTATITGSGTAMTAYTNYLKIDGNWKHEGDVHTAVITFSEEAHYTFAIACTDLAGRGNVPVDFKDSVAPEKFTLDKSGPTDISITINEVSVLGTNSVAFDRFYSSSVAVKLDANYDISGYESMQYQKVTAVSEYNQNGTWLPYDPEIGIVVNPSEKFIIYVRAEDRAGNVSYANSTGIVVDNKQPTGETYAPEIDIMPDAPNEHGFHNGSVNVDLHVIDPKFVGENASETGYYSGLNKITYRIYTTDTDAEEIGVLLDLSQNGGLTAGAIFDADNLIKGWSGKITVNAEVFNSNNVFVEITAIDNAGNIRTSTTRAGEIQIDITPANIEVTYDNNAGDTTFEDGTYFNADRLATIIVTERNFNPEMFVLDLTNTDGYIPVLSDWETVIGTGNGDNTTHKATVLFDKDGDYTMAVSMVDLALNPNVEPTTGDSLAPWEFTIDKTVPVFSVAYDNNDVRNENYYNDQRIATITVNEHNFETSRVVISLKATDNGVASQLPAVSGWRSNGNVHTATITYAADSRYVFDFEYTDKAGNKAADMAEQVFYVDKTNPVLTIEKIVDESANNTTDNIGFVMTATDTNFDVFTPVLTAVIKNGDAFETKQLEIGEITDITNGQVFTVTNIEADGIYRITCTLVDKAGNAFSEVTLEKTDGTKYVEERSGKDVLLTFSVNRDGSTYELDANTIDMIGKYYVQNVLNDIVIVEINADPLQSYRVTLNGKDLVLDTDYTVSEEGGNGNWKKYTYRINKSLFAEEGEYKLVTSSKDKANNDAFSDVKNAAIAFVVDRTAPVVTVSGLATDGRYQTESQIVTLIPTDDGGALKSLIVNMVDDDGKVIKEVINLSGDALTDKLAAEGGMITFTVGEGLYQNVQIICADCATGETEETNVYNETIHNVSVSTSGFMIFWANKSLRWGTIGGVSAIAIAAVAFIILKNKKRNLA